MVTNNPELESKIHVLRDHGQLHKYRHATLGWNARMDGLQGAVLREKLKHLSAWTEARRKNARLYEDLLTDVDEVICPQEVDYGKHVYHIYTIRTKNRDSLIDGLAAKNIDCGIHYPSPLHLQHAYQHLGLTKGSFPVAEKCAKELVSLPMFPELTSNQIDYVATTIKNFLVQRHPESNNLQAVGRGV